MFNVGGAEVLVILLVALIVLGPDKLPEAAKKIGKLMSEVRQMSSGFKREVKSAIDEVDSATNVTRLSEPPANAKPIDSMRKESLEGTGHGSDSAKADEEPAAGPATAAISSSGTKLSEAEPPAGAEEKASNGARPKGNASNSDLHEESNADAPSRTEFSG